MLQKSALAHKAQPQQQDVTRIDTDAAYKIVDAWMEIVQTESALSGMGASSVCWRAVPPVQNAFASILADKIDANTSVWCNGFQPYGWMAASGEAPVDIMRMYLGKKLPGAVVGLSIEDISAAFEKDQMAVVTLHIEDDAQWSDVRMVAAAAVKAGAPVLMLVSTDMAVPAGIAIDVATDWAMATTLVHGAWNSVNKDAAMRIVCMDDTSLPTLERAMMAAASINVQSWNEMIQKNKDGAEMAANAAYLSPVESF